MIPHSQGNLYANQLYDYVSRTSVIPADHVAIYGIATPSSKVNGLINPRARHPNDQFHYITADTDAVINSLRLFAATQPLTDQPLPANTHMEYCKDYVCHDLIEAYLADNMVGNEIRKQINLFFLIISYFLKRGLKKWLKALMFTLRPY